MDFSITKNTVASDNTNETDKDGDYGVAHHFDQW